MERISTNGRAAAAVALGLALLALIPRDAAAQRVAQGQQIDTTFVFAADGDIEIRMPQLGSGSADVTVTGWTRNEVRVIGETSRGELAVNVSGRHIDVGTRGDRGMSRVDRLEVHVPAGTRVHITNGGGDITLHGLTGGVEATSFNGDIELSELGGRVEVKTFNGDISASAITGRLSVNASNGDVDLRGVRGAVMVHTLNGDIDLLDLASKDVQAKTMSGTITYRGSIDPDGSYSLNAFSGGIDMHVPRNTGATLTVSTFSGTIDSPDFPLTLKPGTRPRESKGQSMTFDLGDGRAHISLESFSGDIRLRERRADTSGN